MVVVVVMVVVVTTVVVVVVMMMMAMMMTVIIMTVNCVIAGAFLIPYLICVIIGGVPLFFIEVAVGQFMSFSGIHAWKICPILQGQSLSLHL